MKSSVVHYCIYNIDSKYRNIQTTTLVFPTSKKNLKHNHTKIQLFSEVQVFSLFSYTVIFKF